MVRCSIREAFAEVIMLYPYFFLGTSLPYILSLLLSAIVLTSLDDRWTVDAAPRSILRRNLLTKLHRRVNNNIPGPDVSDYPSDEVIYAICGELDRDQSVMFTEIGDSFPAKYFAFLNNKKIYTDLFPEDPEPFTKMLGRSLKWYQDFADRYSRIYSERSSGTVFLVSNWPRGPVSRCSVWYRIEFPVLRLNPAVEKIILVNKLNYFDQVEIWPVDRRAPEDRPDDDGGDDEGGGGLPRNPLEPGPNLPRLPGVTPVGVVTGLGLLLGGGGVVPALGTVLIPTPGSDPLLPVPAPSDTPPYNPDGENRQDVIFGNSASLPGQDWNTFTGDGSLDGIELSILPSGGSGSAGGKDDIFANNPEPSLWSNGDDGTQLFAADPDLFAVDDDQLTRRHFAILAERDDETCFDWAGNGDDPALAQSSTSGAPTFSQGGKAQWASIRVVQYQKSEPADRYIFDLAILEGSTKNIATEDGLSAPPGEWVSILSPLPYRVYVRAGNNDWDALQFRYGQIEWDSNDVELHDCQFDEWRAGHRTGDCKFIY